MKKIAGIFSIVLILLLVATVGAASSSSSSSTTSTSSSTSTGSTTSSTSSLDTAMQVYVSSVEIDPAVIFPYETGTITVHLTNPGTTSVGLSNPNILDNNIHITKQNYFDSLAYIGPGATLTYTIPVSANPPDGTYFPVFTIATKDGGNIRYPVKLVVDSRELRASISKKPDNFSLSKKDTVNVSVINPRDGELENILITAKGTGVDVTPSESFIGALSAHSAVEVPFQVRPSQQTDLAFHISYNNGENQHTTDVTLPLNIGVDKTAANPIVNNIALESLGSSYQLTGDVNNAGITDAKSMVLTVVEPAHAVEPYSDYAIGGLASDDFSSFTLTFTASDLSSVPLQIQWKDADGNTFATVKNLDLRSISGLLGTSTRTGSSGSTGTAGSASGSSTVRTSSGSPGGGGIFGIGGNRGGGLSSFYLPIGLGVIIIVGIVLYKKRKWIAAKLKKR